MREKWRSMIWAARGGAAGSSAAVNQAIRIRHALPGNAPVPVTMSVGIAGLDPFEPTAEALLLAADASLYDIKRNGRDGIGLQEAHVPVTRRVG